MSFTKRLFEVLFECVHRLRTFSFITSTHSFTDEIRELSQTDTVTTTTSNDTGNTTHTVDYTTMTTIPQNELEDDWGVQAEEIDVTPEPDFVNTKTFEVRLKDRNTGDSVLLTGDLEFELVVDASSNILVRRDLDGTASLSREVRTDTTITVPGPQAEVYINNLRLSIGVGLHELIARTGFSAEQAGAGLRRVMELLDATAPEEKAVEDRRVIRLEDNSDHDASC